MKERPILFSAEMVRAILDGRKTMTRRIVGKYLKIINRNPEEWTGASHHKDGSFIFWGPMPVNDEFAQKAYPDGGGGKCPYGIPGDRLWVRETWHCDNPMVAQDTMSRGEGLYYRATEKHPEIFPKWKPSIFMPKWASRLTLEIIDIKVERLQEITEEDAEAEGATPFRNDPEGDCWTDGKYRTAFQYLWGEINGWEGEAHPRATWQSNLWVWVISFRRIK